MATDGVSADASVFDIAASLQGGPAYSGAHAYGAPIYFGSYNGSPITDSGNLASGSGVVSAGGGGIPWYLWAAVIGGAVLLARKKRRK